MDPCSELARFQATLARALTLGAAGQWQVAIALLAEERTAASNRGRGDPEQVVAPVRHWDLAIEGITVLFGKADVVAPTAEPGTDGTLVIREAVDSTPVTRPGPRARTTTLTVSRRS